MRVLLLVLVYFICQSQTPNSLTGSKMSKSDANKALELHNKARAEVGVPPLEWSKELATYAQAWADHLAADNCAFEHRPQTGKWARIHGENLFWGSSSAYTVVQACNSWYDEKKDFTGPVFTAKEPKVVGHYTQMVWKSTTKVGMGVAKCANGSVVFVANYDPTGNYIGQSPY